VRVAQGGRIGEGPFDIGRSSERVGDAVSKRQGRASARLLAELLAEPLDASRRIDEPLFPGKEGVALRTDVGVDLSLSRPRLERIAAGALYRRRVVFGMDIGFHCKTSRTSIAVRNSWEIYSAAGVKDKPTRGWEFDSTVEGA
jgi:hypothetical protein